MLNTQNINFPEEAFEPLINTIETLAAPDTVIYFASRIRYPKVRYRTQFLDSSILLRIVSSTVIWLLADFESIDYSTIRKQTFTCIKCNGNDCH